MRTNAIKKELKKKLNIFVKDYLTNLTNLFFELDRVAKKHSKQALSDLLDFRTDIFKEHTAIDYFKKAIFDLINEEFDEHNVGEINNVLEGIKAKHILINKKLLQLKIVLFKFFKSESDKKFIDDLFKIYENKNEGLDLILEKTISLFVAVSKKHVGIQEYFGTGKNLIINLPHSKVYLDLRSRIFEESTSKKEKSFARLVKQFEAVQIKKKKLGFVKFDKESVERGILNIYARSIENFLLEHPTFIKTGRVNLYIVLRSEGDEFVEDSLGVYDNWRSGASNIFISFTVFEDGLKAYINDSDCLSVNSVAYSIIVHELSHAFDLSDSETNSFKYLSSVFLLDSELITPKLSRLAELLSSIREEGIAKFNEILVSSGDFVSGWESFDLSQIANLFYSNLLVVKKLFKIAFNPSSSDEIVKNAIPKDLPYDLGYAIFWLIFLNRFSDYYILNLYHSDDLEFDSIKIPSTRLSQYFIKNSNELSTVEIRIKKPEYGNKISVLHKFKSFASGLSLNRFYLEFGLACKNFKIDPSPLTPKFFKSLQNTELKNLNIWLKKMHFSLR